MSVLFVSSSDPFAEAGGENLRLRVFIESVASESESHLLCRSFASRVERHENGAVARFESVGFRPSDRMTRLWRSFALKLPDLALRAWSRRMALALHRRLVMGRYEAVHLSGLQMAYLMDAFWSTVGPDPGRPVLMLDELNAEYMVHERLSIADGGGGRRFDALWSALQRKLLVSYEGRVIGNADTVICPSEDDRIALARLNSSANLEIVPSGIDTGSFDALPPPPDKPVAVFVGDLRYRPNRQAVDWLADRVAPRVWRSVPSAQFIVVGRGRKPVHNSRGKGSFTYTGYVRDLRETLAASKVVLVPLLAGGGMKLKVLEGMAAGRPVVATSVGAAGIEAAPDRQIVIADGESAYANALISVLSDTSRAREIGRAARKQVRARYDSSTVGSAYVEVLRRTLEKVGS